jgi:hypothetical protein
MSQAFYSHARLYDLVFSGGGPAVDVFRAEANRQGGSVLELGCGTGNKLVPSRPTGIRASAWTPRQTCWLRLSARRSHAG